MEFLDLVAGQDEQFERKSIADQRILCFDPGHTTGWALFVSNTLADSGQIETRDMADAGRIFQDMFVMHKPTYLVVEDYRVYRNKQAQHIGSRVHTTHVIGAIETIAGLHYLDIKFRMAALAKGFCKDDKLKEWGFYQTGLKHARDAIRHGCYHILFYHSDKDRGLNPHITTTTTQTKRTVG